MIKTYIKLAEIDDKAEENDVKTSKIILKL